MCRNEAARALGAGKMHARGFWSIDAAFALVMSVAMFAVFSSLVYAAGASVARGAEDAGGELLCLRFSEYALPRLERGEEIDLQAVLQGTGRKYASLRFGDEFSYAGQRGGAVYCTQRLGVEEGKLVRMEACIG